MTHLHIDDIQHSVQHLSFHHVVFLRIRSERGRGIHLEQPGLEVLVNDDVIAYESELNIMEFSNSSKYGCVRIALYC